MSLKETAMYEIKNNMKSGFSFKELQALMLYSSLAVVLYACSSSSGSEAMRQMGPQSLPVVAVTSVPATTYLEYSASLEGSKDIEIRPQVDGYIDRIYVDEGAYVRKGQVLFHINDRPYREQLNNARAAVAAARANLATAEINVSRLKPLVESGIISDVQLKTAQSNYNAALANVSQAQAAVSSAQINLGYATIKAPANGYIGRIPLKTGSLVGMSTPEPLTVLSEVRDVYAYFSLSESDFIQFKNQYSGNTIEEKIKQLPPVELILADGTVYPKQGRVQTVSGQFNNTTGAISFRAIFENTDGILRSGNTGKVRLSKTLSSAIAVPQEATYEMQDRTFVFVVADSNKVVSTPITIAEKTGNYYLVENGVKAGDKIVYSGLDRLQDGAVIQPQVISMDSILKAKPLQ
jgi:membrane fusion protein (multidrug efflux system)